MQGGRFLPPQGGEMLFESTRVLSVSAGPRPDAILVLEAGEKPAEGPSVHELTLVDGRLRLTPGPAVPKDEVLASIASVSGAVLALGAERGCLYAADWRERAADDCAERCASAQFVRVTEPVAGSWGLGTPRLVPSVSGSLLGVLADGALSCLKVNKGPSLKVQGSPVWRLGNSGRLLGPGPVACAAARAERGSLRVLIQGPRGTGCVACSFSEAREGDGAGGPADDVRVRRTPVSVWPLAGDEAVERQADYAARGADAVSCVALVAYPTESRVLRLGTEGDAGRGGEAAAWSPGGWLDALSTDEGTLALGQSAAARPATVQVTPSCVRVLCPSDGRASVAWRPDEAREGPIVTASVLAGAERVLVQCARDRRVLWLEPGEGAEKLSSGDATSSSTHPWHVEAQIRCPSEICCFAAAPSAAGACGDLYAAWATRDQTLTLLSGDRATQTWSIRPVLRQMVCHRNKPWIEDLGAPPHSLALVPRPDGAGLLCLLGLRSGRLLVLEVGEGAPAAAQEDDSWLVEEAESDARAPATPLRLRAQTLFSLGSEPVELLADPPSIANVPAGQQPVACAVCSGVHVVLAPETGPGALRSLSLGLDAVRLLSRASAPGARSDAFLAFSADGEVTVSRLSGPCWERWEGLDAGARPGVRAEQALAAVSVCSGPLAGEEVVVSAASWHNGRASRCAPDNLREDNRTADSNLSMKKPAASSSSASPSTTHAAGAPLDTLFVCVPGRWAAWPGATQGHVLLERPGRRLRGLAAWPGRPGLPGLVILSEPAGDDAAHSCTAELAYATLESAAPRRVSLRQRSVLKLQRRAPGTLALAVARAPGGPKLLVALDENLLGLEFDEERGAFDRLRSIRLSDPICHLAVLSRG